MKTISNKIGSLLALYDLHTGYFVSAIDGISDTDAHKRLNTKANHIAWLAGSLVQQRYEMAQILGIDKKQTAHELFKDNKGIQDNVIYPSLITYKNDWENITPFLKDALTIISDEKLNSIFEMPEIPEMKMTYFELITFMIYREANCIGQIALWRRLLGYDPMKYM